MALSSMAKALVGIAAACLACAALAQEYPSRPIRIIHNNMAGALADIVSRQLAGKLSQSMKVPVIVEAKPGGSGAVAANSLLAAPSDGYSLMLMNASMVLLPITLKGIDFDIQKDFAPIAVLASIPLMMAVHPSLPVRNMSELIAYSKANPDKLNIAGTGSGSVSQLGMELFKLATGVSAVYIPLAGGGVPGELLSGRTQLAYSSFQELLERSLNGQFRPFLVFTARRHPALPDVPTAVEATGRPELDLSTWYSMVVRAGTSPQIASRLEREFLEMMESPDLIAVMEKLRMIPTPGSAQELAKKISSDTEKWRRTVALAKLKFD